jgi:hypothetical protein
MKTEPTLMLEVILNSTNSSHWINSKYLHHSMDDIKEITGDHYIIGKEEMDEIAGNVMYNEHGIDINKGDEALKQLLGE